MSRFDKWKKAAPRLWVLVGLTVLAAATAYFLSLMALISTHFEGRRWDLPSRIYSDAFTLYPGINLKTAGFMDRLRRLSYAEVDHPVAGPGEYFRDGQELIVYFHQFDYPKGSQPARAIRLEVESDTLKRIYDLNTRREVYTEKLEPEVVSEFFGEVREERLLVKIDQIPKYMQSAVIATEDQRFFEHHGIDLRAIARAMVTNLRAGGIRQGGSTLTQQLVKNFLLTSKRSFARKFNEASMALLVEQRYSKPEILECYLNEVYFGQRGSVAIHGIGEAARHYFGKPVAQLSLAEAALLAGIIKGPAIYSPYNHLDKSLERQRIVLALMREQNLITEDEQQAALREQLPLKKPYILGSENAYFVDLVRRQLELTYPEDELTAQGLRIFTSIDVQIQHVVAEELKKGIERLEKANPALLREPELEGAVIILQPQTGFILAASGGRDFATSQYNRAIFAKRQPGSLFKPFVALAAFNTGRKNGGAFTPLTEIVDEEIEIKTATGEIWKPLNYDKIFRGPVTLREALENSINIPMIKVAHEVGPERVVGYAQRLGIESELKAVDSLALGTSEATPFEIARAFATIANGGIRPELLSVRDVVTPEGQVLERRRMEVKEVVSPESAYLTTELMAGVMDRGTGRGARTYGLTQTLAGKTGTTSEYRDAWFVGFSPDLLGLVWIGFDDNYSMNLSGAAAALPIWASVMKRVMGTNRDQPFLAPSGVIEVLVDRDSHEAATGNCPKENLYEEVFITGTEPKTSCHFHPDSAPAKTGLWNRLKGIF